MGFRDPLFLLLLLAVVPFVYRLFYYKRGDATFRFSFFKTALKQSSSQGQAKYTSLALLYILAWVFAVLACAGPQQSKQFEKRLSEGVDLMIALDVSGSMRSIDDAKAAARTRRRGYYYAPPGSLTNRLQYAKRLTAEFIGKRKDDRIGLVVFAGYSYTKCPLTFDHALLKRILASVNFKDVKSQMTAIGMAIANGVNRLRRSKAKSRVLILVTDGVNNVGAIDPVTAAQLAKALQIKVYTIGVGSNHPLAPGRSFFRRTGKKKYYVRSQSYIDEATLKKIAKLTGGRYFRATGSSKLGDIYDQIDRLEKTKIEKKHFVEHIALYQPFLIAALLCLLLAQSLRYLVFRMNN